MSAASPYAIKSLCHHGKTSCFGIIEGIFFNRLRQVNHTKTSCFAIVMVGDAFRKRVTLVIT